MAHLIETKSAREVITILEEFHMAAVRDPHADLTMELGFFLRQILKGTDYKVKVDVYRYLDPDVSDRFGNFKNGMAVDHFVRGLKRFGARKEFIQQKLDEFSAAGVPQGSYAPDVCVIRRADDYDQFGVPLMLFEVISASSREHDLYFKSFFYETIGVQEYFIAEATRGRGVLIKAYRLEEERYKEIPLEDDRYFSAVLNQYIPKTWEL